MLGTALARDRFLSILEETRRKYGFAVLGYVAMPEHVHLLVTEPERGGLASVVQVVKQRFSRTREEDWVWEERYYDFNVRSERKRVEKLRYIHRNPVRRGLVVEPEEWGWSSFRAYALSEVGPVVVSRSWG